MKKSVFLLVLALLLLFFLPAGAEKEEITSLSQLNQPGILVGIPQGSMAELAVETELPAAKLVYFTDNATAYLALNQGKIDAFVFDTNQIRIAMENGVTGVHLLPETMGETARIAVGISPVSMIDDLQGKLNRFIAQLKADGTLEDMFRRWVIDGEESMPEIPVPVDAPVHLTVGTTGVVRPYTYYSGDTLIGYDIELARRFAAFLGADLTFRIYDYGGIIPAAAFGDVDCIMANLNMTPERQEALPFSDVLYEETLGILVRGEPPAAGASPGRPSFFESAATSFHKTFIREGRWHLFLRGVGTTTLITLLSVLFGTALGFLLFLLCRNGNPAAVALTRFATRLIQGTPVVVLLMILYYIIFGSVAVSGIAVAVLGFTLTFGSAVLELLRIGVGAVDRGQYEAACALGYSGRRAFFRIILPQAIPHVFPAWQGEIVTLIKATSVVGYIAVQDLTKMGDIIRSRTYEAFFPLMAVTVIYFLLEGLFSFAVSRIRLRMDPRERSPERILKGVKTDD